MYWLCTALLSSLITFIPNSLNLSGVSIVSTVCSRNSRVFTTLPLAQLLLLVSVGIEVELARELEGSVVRERERILLIGDCLSQGTGN